MFLIIQLAFVEVIKLYLCLLAGQDASSVVTKHFCFTISSMFGWDGSGAGEQEQVK